MQKFIFASLLLISSAFAQDYGKVIYVSPDETLKAVVTPTSVHDPLFHEHTIQILNNDGKQITKKDFSSRDHDHGRGVLRASWSPDSKFFVVSTTSSGGHSAWHYSTFAYVRQLKKIFYLDDLVGGPIVDPSFFFTSPAVFRASRLNYKDGEKISDEPIPVAIDLNSVNFKNAAEQDAAANP